MDEMLEILLQNGQEIQNIHKRNIERRSANGIIGGAGLAPKEANEWFSDVRVFLSRYIQDHPLRDSLENALFQENTKMRDVEKIMGILKSLQKDTLFLEEKREKEENLNETETINSMLKIDIDKCEMILKNNEVEQDELKELYQTITARYDSLIKNFGNGLYSYFPENHFYDSEVEIDTLKYNLKSLIEKMTVYRLTISNDSTSSVVLDNQKQPIIFISHKSSDSKYGEIIRNLLIQIGIRNNEIVFTSNPSNKIPFGSNIFEYLREKIHSETYVLYLLSNDYFKSTACLNEMGAAWVSQANNNSLFVPDFDYNDPDYINSCLDTKNMGINLSGDRVCRNGFVEMIRELRELFNLELSDTDLTNFSDEACEKLQNM